MLKVEYKKTAELIPYSNNSRTHDDSQVAQIAASIKEFWFTNPIYVDVIVQRWQDFTGKEATHSESGKTYIELSDGKTT